MPLVRFLLNLRGGPTGGGALKWMAEVDCDSGEGVGVFLRTGIVALGDKERDGDAV